MANPSVEKALKRNLNFIFFGRNLWTFICMSILSTGLLCFPRPANSSPNYGIVIGPNEVVFGPDKRIDSPFQTFQTEDNLYGYFANLNTWLFSGPSLNSLKLLPRPALSRGEKDKFDGCGAWMEGALVDGNVVRGWYHAEAPTPACTKGRWKTRKTVAYAESRDGGATFFKPNYPNNIVLSAPAEYTDPEDDDEGDFKVLQVGDKLLMYFVSTQHSRGWRVHVARSDISSGGQPGTWWKYYNGTFSEPGIGGRSSPLTKKYSDLSSASVAFNEHLDSFIGIGSLWYKGKKNALTFSFSKDGITWESWPHKILPTSDRFIGRNGPGAVQFAGDYMSAVSIISEDGDSNSVGKTFWLYYMYLSPESNLKTGRQLVRRKIEVMTTPSNFPKNIIPKIALSYFSGPNGFGRLTTTSTDPAYVYQSTVGYLRTEMIPDSVEIWECADKNNARYLATTGNACPKNKAIRSLGWISRSSEGTGRKPLLLCQNDSKLTSPPCSGKSIPIVVGYLDTRH